MADHLEEDSVALRLKREHHHRLSIQEVALEDSEAVVS